MDIPELPLAVHCVADLPMPYGKVRDVLPSRDGRLFVLDASRRRVACFDRSGAEVCASSDDRLGPFLTRVLAIHDGLICVPDVLQHRIDIYDPVSLTLREEIPIDPHDGFPSEWVADADGRLYQSTTDLPSAGFGDPLAVLGQPVTRIRRFQDGQFRELASIPVPGWSPDQRVTLYGPRIGWSVRADGTVVLAGGLDGLMAYVREGEPPTLVPCPAAGRDLSEPERRTLANMAAYEKQFLAEVFSLSFEGDIDAPQIASCYPAFMQMIADDSDRIWFRLPATVSYLQTLEPSVGFRTMDSGSSTWLVYDRDGQRRWRVEFPFAFEPTRVRDRTVVGYVYGGSADRVQVYEFDSQGA